jgi:hypothetical protein
MSLSITIDESKIKESLRTASKPEYVVTMSHVMQTEVRGVDQISNLVAGTSVPNDEPNVNVRSFILGLRRNIEESGMPLKSSEELEKELAEMRERHSR